MTKRDINSLIAVKTKLPRHVVCKVTDLFMDSVIDAVLRDGRMELRGFGVFRLFEKPERTRRVPKTGQLIRVGKESTIKFKLSSVHVKRFENSCFDDSVVP